MLGTHTVCKIARERGGGAKNKEKKRLKKTNQKSGKQAFGKRAPHGNFGKTLAGLIKDITGWPGKKGFLQYGIIEILKGGEKHRSETEKPQKNPGEEAHLGG